MVTAFPEFAVNAWRKDEDSNLWRFASGKWKVGVVRIDVDLVVVIRVHADAVLVSPSIKVAAEQLGIILACLVKEARFR